MQWEVKSYGGRLISAAAPYSAVVHYGATDGEVDLPAASGATGFAGIVLPMTNLASGSNIPANSAVDIAVEGIVRFNKATDYSIQKGEALVIYDSSGNLCGVDDAGPAAGSNIEVAGYATEQSETSDEWGYMKLDHNTLQG